jgi:hypothetical protein
MFRTLRDMLLGAFVCAAIGAAVAAVGTPPGTGPGLVDGAWLNGLAGGQNYTYQSGISAAGTTQATGTQLPTNIYLIEIDTVASSTGVNLPPCIPGTQIQIYNNGANTLTIYPAVANNPITAAQDTINNTTSITLNSHVATSPACAKAGVWYAS